MAYRLKYNVWVLWVGPGTQPGGQQASKVQTLEFFDAANTTGTSTFTNADVATLITAMSNDLTTQMEVPATQTRIQNFASGGG
jgi:hypothetical protein